jgi:NAD(P) transhydrogenase
MNQRELYGASYRVKDRITPADLLARTQHVIGKEVDVVRNQLMRNRIDLLVGHGRFVDSHTVVVEDPGRREMTTVSGDYIVIATGTRPARPSGVEFDEERVLDSDGILDLKSLPASMVVVGAGVIGIEYASMFAALGTKVTVVEKRDDMLDFCDPEVVEALKFHLRDLAVTFRFGEEVTAVDVGAAGTVTTLASGKQIPAETVMYSAGRQGQTDHLDLHNAGLEVEGRGRIWVDEKFQTKVEHIYAVGDVIGFPALASTSMEQGRLAAYHAFGEACEGITDLQPIGIYSIPEISYVGATEVELTKDAVPYEVGVARYKELARGQIAGDSYGMRWNRRLPGRRGVQLSDVLRGLQGGRAGRDEQDAGSQPVPPLISSCRRGRWAPGRRDRRPPRGPAIARFGRRTAPSTTRSRRTRRARSPRSAR